MTLLVVDTDVAAAILNNQVPARLASLLAGQHVGVTFVTVGELSRWAAIHDWGPRKLADLAVWRGLVVVLGYDDRIAMTWGRLQARAELRGRPHSASVTWIAACCLAWERPLATFSSEDYADFAVHEGLSLLDLS